MRRTFFNSTSILYICLIAIFTLASYVFDQGVIRQEDSIRKSEIKIDNLTSKKYDVYTISKELNSISDYLTSNLINISRNRVSEENAPVTIINPKHPALNTPNKILLTDFDGWVQERGLYFPNEWSNNYQTLITSNDRGEKPNDGGILIAKVGKGNFVYTSYSWFRQLPAGVSGAYKIFSNLLSLGKE